MPRARLLKAFLILSATCSSACSTADRVEDKIVDQGPSITACVVDVANQGYQCARYDSNPYFVGFDKVGAGGMVCVSPVDLEITLKTCKKGQALETTLCTVQNQTALCKDAQGKPLSLNLPQLDNYLCMSPQDRERLMQRCNSRGY